MVDQKSKDHFASLTLSFPFARPALGMIHLAAKTIPLNSHFVLISKHNYFTLHLVSPMNTGARRLTHLGFSYINPDVRKLWNCHQSTGKKPAQIFIQTTLLASLALIHKYRAQTERNSPGKGGKGAEKGEDRVCFRKPRKDNPGDIHKLCNQITTYCACVERYSSGWLAAWHTGITVCLWSEHSRRLFVCREHGEEMCVCSRSSHQKL